MARRRAGPRGCFSAGATTRSAKSAEAARSTSIWRSSLLPKWAKRPLLDISSWAASSPMLNPSRPSRLATLAACRRMRARVSSPLLTTPKYERSFFLSSPGVAGGRRPLQDCPEGVGQLLDPKGLVDDLPDTGGAGRRRRDGPAVPGGQHHWQLGAQPAHAGR